MRNLGSDWLRVASGEVGVEGNMSELKAGRHHMCKVAHDPLFLKMGYSFEKAGNNPIGGYKDRPVVI